MAERRPKHAGLERVLGTSALFSTAYGNVGSSIYYALGLVAVFALGMTPLIFVISGFIFFLTAATYSEATAMYPEAGGSSSFARHAFNEFWSFVAGWGQMLNYIITVSISAFFVPHYLGIFWAPLRGNPWDIVVGIALIGILAVVNIVGAREAAGLNIFLAVADFLTQVALVVVGAILVLDPDTLVNNVHFGTAPTLTNFLIAIPVGMVAYTGIETISNMAEEARDTARTVPRAIRLVVFAVFAIYAGIPAVALSALPVTCSGGECTTALATTYAGDPILGIVKNLHLGALQQAGEIYVGVLAATILLIATNAGIIGVSRLTYSMGQHRQLPEGVRRIHSRFRTPYVAIALFGGVAALTIVPGQAKFLGTLYSFGAMLSFTMAHLAVIGLRKRFPERERPHRGPGSIRIGGFDLPLFAVVGGFGTAAAWVTVTVLNPATALAGGFWLAIGLTTYVVYRRRAGLNLTQTAKVIMPRPIVEQEVEYNSILLVFENLKYSREALDTAAKLAARRRRGVHVLITITAPLHLPVDAMLDIEERRAASVLESARLAGGRRVSGESIKVRAGEAGHRIVEVARRINAEAIVMPLPRRHAGTLFGKTLETVLSERPCRVIVTSEPGTAAMPRLIA